MTAIDGYTLFPHNGWSTGRPVKWSRRWQTGVGSGIQGNEARSALRQLPLHKLTCALAATSLPERVRLDARIDQAKKSGFGAVPFYGRAGQLTANAAAGANTVTVAASSLWAWTAGDWIFLYQDDATFDALKVQSVAGNVLTLAGNLANAWLSGGNLWPLLLGKFSSENSTAVSGFLAGWTITIEQLASERNAAIGAVTPPAGSGVGFDTVGVDNTVS
ncbi:MAG: hypothetical protein P4N60_11240 [Verrucomicrobiae bacterium]|nr:hypothetical protein [Verrucomicrobiae bacterium]